VPGRSHLRDAIAATNLLSGQVSASRWEKLFSRANERGGGNYAIQNIGDCKGMLFVQEESLRRTW
jgi:hypothetical protein